MSAQIFVAFSAYAYQNHLLLVHWRQFIVFTQYESEILNLV